MSKSRSSQPRYDHRGQAIVNWLVLFACVSSINSGFGDEVVVLDANGKASRRRQGTIVDLRGDTLTLQLSTGRTTKVPIERVQAIDAKWSDRHVAANELYERRDFAKALELYRAAFNQEKRDWVKRRLLSRVVWCYRNLGKNAEACRMFARMVTEDPATPYFDSIPLQWETKQCPADVKSVVSGWLASNASPAKQLIAASWLMVSDRTQSLASLRELGKNPSQAISSLAVAQLWKAELLTLQESRMRWWKEQTESMPAELRAGNYYLLGKSLERFDRDDDAVLAYLRVPALFTDDISLGQTALVQAGDILDSQSHHQEAVTVYRQAVELGPNSRVGKQAAQALAKLVN